MPVIHYQDVPGNAPNALFITSVSRPALTLTEFYNAFGDSTTFGVGSASGSDWPNMFRAIATGPTAAFNGGTGSNNNASIVEIGNGGVGGENSTSITARVTGLSPTYAAQLGRHGFYFAGLNDYNSGVSGWTRNWPAQVKTNYATAAAAITGGKKFYCFPPIHENNNAPGIGKAADYRFYFHDMTATYGNLLFDMERQMRHVRQLEAPSGTADATALAMGHLPYKYRGNSATSDFADVDFPEITGSGAPASLAYDEGTVYWDTVALTPYRKLGANGAGSWTSLDRKHLSKWGNQVIARITGDLAKALEGSGPPVVNPARFRIAADAAQGATVGQLLYTGTPTRFALRTITDGPVTDYAVSSGGLVTKAASGSLTQGVDSIVAVVENEYGVLTSPVDVFVARPSTVTAPALRTIASPGVSVVGRKVHGMADGKAISGAFMFRVPDFPATRQIVLLTRASGTPTQPVSISMNNAGRLNFTARDSTNTLISNTTSAAGLLVANTTYCVLWALDYATNTKAFYINDVSQTLGNLINGSNIPLADSDPLFLSARSPDGFDNGSLMFTGEVGLLMFWDGYVDWTNSTNRRAVFNADNTAATRTPYSAVGGLVPKFEIWGGKGDWLWGSPDGSYDKIMSVSHKARTVMS